MLVAQTVSIADMEAPADLAANENDTAEKHSGSSLELIWKERARKLADMVYALEVEKLEMKRKLATQGKSDGSTDAAALRAQLSKSNSLREDEQTIAAKHAMTRRLEDVPQLQSLRVTVGAPNPTRNVDGDKASATGPTNANITVRPWSAGSCASNTAKLPLSKHMNRVEGKENRPSILQHVDVSVMQAMLREKEGELAVWREDAGAKGRELIRALELLQAAQTRESELRCQAANLTGQLMIMQDALMQSEVDLDDLEQQIAELNGNSETVNSMTQLAQARADAERYASRAAALESALLESERRVQELEAKAGRLQSFISGPAIVQHQTFDRYEELECFAGKQAGELVETQPTQPDFASRPGVVLCVARTVLLPRVCAAVLAALTRAMRER